MIQSMDNLYVHVAMQDDGTVFIAHKANPDISLEVCPDEDRTGLCITIGENAVADNKGEFLHVSQG